MSKINGPIKVWFRDDTIPTSTEGGYAGGDSTAAALVGQNATIDSISERVDDFTDSMVGAFSTSTRNGLTTLSWSGGTADGGGGGGGGGSVDWSAITGKPAAFPPAPHSHPAEEIEAGGVANEWTYLRGDGQWAPPRNGAVITGGILRIYPDGVEIHTNNSHGNTGIRGFGEDADGKNIWDESGRLIVKHVAAGGVIVYIGASPDETLVKNGITAGCSGGVGTTIVQFAQYGQPLDMRLPEDYAKVAGNYSNLWITWVHQATGGA